MLAVDAGHSDIAEYLRRQERAAAAAAALLEEEEREVAAKAASKGKKKKKKGKKQGALPPPEQAPASPREGPSETTDETQVRCLSRRLVRSCSLPEAGGVNATMGIFEVLISCSSSGTDEGSTQSEC
jgi:Tfp pilus assembly protein PilX